MNRYESVKSAGLFGLAVVVASLLGTAARAAVVTVPLEAVVVLVDDYGDYLRGAIRVGDRIRGSYTYETTTVDVHPWASVGDYWHYTSPFGMKLEVNGLRFRTDSTQVEFLIEICNNHTGCDYYLLRSYQNVFDRSVPDVGGMGVMNHMSWQLDDPTMKALSSDALPYGLPDLAAWQQVFGLDLSSEGSGEYFLVRAVVIPEPTGGATVAGLGLAAFAAGARRVRRPESSRGPA